MVNRVGLAFSPSRFVLGSAVSQPYGAGADLRPRESSDHTLNRHVVMRRADLRRRYWA